MPRNTSGIYTLPGGNPVTPGAVIEAEWANTTLEDVADALTNSLSRTGAGGMLAPFRIADGSVSGPGLSYLNETNTGLYRSGSGSTWMAVLGVNVAQFSTVGVNIPFGKSLTAAGNASVSGTFAVGGATTLGSTLAVTGALTATGGVTGNVAGNVTATTGTSTFNDMVITGSLDMTAGSSATITGLSTPTNASDAANKGYVDTQDALRLALTGGTMSGVIAMGNSKITGLATPTADQDAATKAYVDSIAQGLDVKGSCRAATTGNITLSGAQTIDGVAIIAGDRVLVKDQSTAANNGIYVAAAGSWSRSTDADTWSELVGAFTFVEEGTVNDNSGWVCTSPAGGTLGVTAVTWEQFSGAGQITAGAGLFKSGNTINVGTAAASRIVVGTDDIDLATTGVTASTYKSVTVDAYGRVTAGTNPTTLAGFGITDAYTQTQVNDALALKLNLTGGTMSGVIAMGANKITGLADPTLAQDAATKNYIDTIFGSTTSAAASAAAAASSASAAATSATNAASSATSAAGSATSAASSYTTFNNQYLGSKTSDPTTNNTGGALVAGNLYWNSTVNEMRVYSGSAWTAAYLPGSAYMDLTTNQTAAGVKTFSSNPILSAGTANGVVYLNGSKALTSGSGLVFDGTNLGLGVTPSAWATVLPVLELKNGVHFGALSTSTPIGYLGANTYYNGSNWVYKVSSNYATRYELNSDGLGKHAWFTAGAGTAGNAITFTQAMTLDASGRLAIGATSVTNGTAFGGGSQVNVAKIESAGYPCFQINTNTGGGSSVQFTNSGTVNGVIGYNASGGTNEFSVNNALSGALVLATNNTERARIDSSGNLLVGTTSADAKLTVSGAAGYTGAGLCVIETSTGTAKRLRISQDSAAAVYDATYSSGGNYHVWKNGGSEVARLDGSGSLLVGTTGSIGGVTGASVQVLNNGSSGIIVKQLSGPSDPISVWNSATSGDNMFVQFYTETAVTSRGSITYNRGAGLVAYNTTSDYRAKDISGPVTGSGELIDSTPVYMGKMKGATQERPMFIAHETPAYAHTGEKDAVDADGNPVYQQMDASALIPVMWAEIQSLRTRVAQLESN